jgi:peroxiredoxin Q/BCP
VLLENGSLAPNVELPGDAGQFYNLNDYRGQKVILYFYPKDDTSGCTTQACEFRDQLEDFNNLNVAVFGISRDTPQAHDKFKYKYQLTFPLLSDVDGTACTAYGTWVEKSMCGKKYFGIERSTFLIDEVGIISHIWRKVKVAGHVEEVLEILHKT